MANEIIQGDNGIVFEFIITDNDEFGKEQIVDITGTNVEVLLKYRAIRTLKQATITDGVNGKCEITLLSEDISHEGIYSFQATVKYPDDTEFSSKIVRFLVSKKMGYVPVVGGGSSDIGDSATNGNLVVNGIEIKVYDDTQVRADISNLKLSQHTHANKDALDKLGVNAQNHLTIDGVELVAGGGVKGDDGASAYDLWLAQGNTGTTQDFLNSLKGEKGDTGDSGSGGTLPSNVILFEDWVGGETVTIDTSTTPTNTAPSISSSYNTTSAFSNDIISIPYTITDAEGGSLTSTYTKDGVTSNATVSTGANTWSVGTLSIGSHTLTIQVSDNGGLTSNTLTFNIIVSASADTTPPSDVSGLAAGTSTIHSIPVSWTLSPSGDVANYEVAYSSNGGSTWTVSSSLVNSSSTSYTITGLVAETNYTVRVVAIDTSSNRSNGVTVTKSTAVAVNYVLSASPSTGTYNTAQNVVLSANPTGGTIYYTTNGSTPTASSSIYSSAIPVSANTTIKFFAQDSVGNVSSVQTATYTIDTIVPVLTITPASTFTTTQTVTMSANETATIYYTLDDSDPKTSGTKLTYTSPLTLTETDTVKAYAVDTVGNESTVQTVTYTKQSLSVALIYPENGYLIMPPNQYTWTALTGQSDSNYVRVGSNTALASMFDQSLPTPVTFDNLPFVTYSATHTNDYNENVSIATGSAAGRIGLKLSTSRGADGTALNTYLQNTDKKLGIKLATGYKTLSISSNISNVTTRTSSVDTTKFEYFKCTLLDGIGEYVTPATNYTQFSSNGYRVTVASDYVFSRTYLNIRVNADGTLEMLLPKGTLATIDVAGVSSYLASVNLKIYYI